MGRLKHSSVIEVYAYGCITSVKLDSAKYSSSNRLAGLNEWNDVSDEIIDSKILAFFLNLTFVLAITGETYSFFLAYRLCTVSRSNSRYGLHETEKYRHDDAK